METGRELDTLVAEKVMGWTRFDFEQLAYGGTIKRFTWVLPKDLEVWNESNKLNVNLFPLARAQSEWSPSANKADVWKVVDAMFQKDLWLYLSRDIYGYNAGFVKRSIAPDWKWTVMGFDMPLAICIAALESLGVKIEHPEHKTYV